MVPDLGGRQRQQQRLPENPHRIASVNPISCPAISEFCTSFTRLAAPHPIFSPHKRASCSTTGALPAIFSLDLRLASAAGFGTFQAPNHVLLSHLYISLNLIQNSSHIVNIYFTLFRVSHGGFHVFP
jgi:hypothetical protein